jgi:CheY-like chemotaxis protein
MVPLRILVVDDDALSRDLLTLLLAREGHSAEAVASGEAAVAHLACATIPCDLALVDLQMPGLSGSALAYKLRATTPAIPQLLAISASQPPDEALDGFDGFLLKPFSMDALDAAIKRETHQAHHHAASPGTKILDLDIYRKLEASMSTEKLSQLYELCLSDVRKRVATMRRAAAEGDDTTYRREAHSIKGGCGLVGASELQTIAASGENDGIVANHVATLDEFLLACERLERMLVANKQFT